MLNVERCIPVRPQLRNDLKGAFGLKKVSGYLLLIKYSKKNNNKLKLNKNRTQMITDFKYRTLILRQAQHE